jgi:hypothetical protein
MIQEITLMHTQFLQLIPVQRYIAGINKKPYPVVQNLKQRGSPVRINVAMDVRVIVCRQFSYRSLTDN